MKLSIRLAFLFSILLACVAGAQDIRVGRAPGNFTGSNVTASSYTATSTGNAFVQPTNAKDCLNGATCTVYVSSDGTNLSAVAPGTVNVSALAASTSVQTPAILGPNGTTRIAIPSNGTTTITSTQPTTGSAVGTVLDTTQTYVSGDLLFKIGNNGTQELTVDNTGGINNRSGLFQNGFGGSISLRGSKSDSGGATTAIVFKNANTLTNNASNIWCGYSDDGTTSQLCLRKDGSLIPNNGGNLGAANTGFGSMFVTNWFDGSASLRASLAASAANQYTGKATTSGTASAHKFGNLTTLSTAGDHIAEFYNDNLSTLKLSIDKDGSVIPATAGASDLGSASNVFRDTYVTSLRDATGTFRLSGLVGGNSNNYRGSTVTSGTAIAHKFGNVNALSTAGDQIAGYYNNDPTSSGVERSYIGYDGSYNGLVNATGGVSVTQIATPSAGNIVVTPSITGGTLAAGSYCYRVSVTSYGVTETLASTEVCSSVASGSTGSETVSWAPVIGATGYKVYCRATGAEQLCQTITNPTTISWADNGSVTPSGAVPTANSTGRFVLGEGSIVDVTGVTRWSSAINSTNWVRGSVFDGASAVGVTLDNKNTLSTAGSEIVEVRNNGVKESHIDPNGGYTVDGSGNLTVQTNSKVCLDASCNVNLSGNGTATVTLNGGITVNFFKVNPASGALSTCSSSIEGQESTVHGTGGVLTQKCLCTWDGTTAKWINLLNPSVRTGTTTTCPAS